MGWRASGSAQEENITYEKTAPTACRKGPEGCPCPEYVLRMRKTKKGASIMSVLRCWYAKPDLRSVSDLLMVLEIREGWNHEERMAEERQASTKTA